MAGDTPDATDGDGQAVLAPRVDGFDPLHDEPRPGAKTERRIARLYAELVESGADAAAEQVRQTPSGGRRLNAAKRLHREHVKNAADGDDADGDHRQSITTADVVTGDDGGGFDPETDPARSSSRLSVVERYEALRDAGHDDAAAAVRQERTVQSQLATARDHCREHLGTSNPGGGAP